MHRDGIYCHIKAWEICAYSSKQQPVELPKPDPLEELIDVCQGKLTYSVIADKNILREFAQKARALK